MEIRLFRYKLMATKDKHINHRNENEQIKSIEPAFL